HRLHALNSLLSATTRQGTAPGQEIFDPLTQIAFVWVPGGEFQMGCGSWSSDCHADELPVHTAKVDGFWLGKYEVTQGQWLRLMGNNPSKFALSENNPVDNISWEDAQLFIRKNNASNPAQYRLPTGAEWEFACRSGGKEELYAGGQ
ncbi:MAG: formylglycine-generating enzyme family protein, partial [Magnetococcus sp. YQC-3]